MLDRPADFDEREINRKAVRFFPQIHSLIVDMHGRPLAADFAPARSRL